MCSWQVFQYQWHDQPITYDVMLVLLSFILAWGEAWFFDFRMVSKHHCCIIRKKILTLTTHHRFPWKPKPKRSGERRHSDQIILRTRGRRYLQEVARGACWPGTRFHSITEKSPHSKPTYHHQTSTGQNSDSMCSNIFYKRIKAWWLLGLHATSRSDRADFKSNFYCV